MQAGRRRTFSARRQNSRERGPGKSAPQPWQLRQALTYDIDDAPNPQLREKRRDAVRDLRPDFGDSSAAALKFTEEHTTRSLIASAVESEQ